MPAFSLRSHSPDDTATDCDDNINMADAWANTMACHPRATYHIV